MSGWLSEVLALLATGLRGLRSRRLLTAGSVLLASIAIAAAVVGPMYQSAAGASFLVTRLQTAPNFTTGLTLDYRPRGAVGYRDAEQAALAAVPPSRLEQFGAPQVSLLSDPLPVTSAPFAFLDAEATLLARRGGCEHLVVTGSCPTRRGETALLEFDAQRTRTRIGDQLTVAGISTPLTVVGTYTVRDATTDFWFDLTRFASVLPQPKGGGLSPYYPAPFLVAAGTFGALDAGGLIVRMDRRLTVTPMTTIDDLRAAVQSVSNLSRLLERPLPGGSLDLGLGNALRSVVGQEQARRVTAEQTVTPAVISLILVALVLLFRLLAASMELRMPELALAGLRGLSARRRWVLALLEPVLMLTIAAPVGLGCGYVAARLLAAEWLVPGLPVEFRASSAKFAVGVLVAALGVAVLVVRAATAEPLSMQIAGTRRPRKSSRWAVVLRLALVAAAVAVLAGTLGSGGTSKPSATDLLLPVLLAVAAGVLTTLFAAFAAGRWAKRTARGRGVASYVASRTIARRREGTLVILPLTAALAIAVFAAGTYAAAANWRASNAATMVGADLAFPVKLPLSQAVALTHRVDPTGRWLMAVGADADSNGLKVIVDAPRLERVATWPSSWTPGLSVAELSQALSPVRPALTLAGRRVELTVDNRVNAESDGLLVVLETVTPTGEARSVIVGPYSPGRTTKSALIRSCEAGCDVSSLTISGQGPFAQVMRGTVTVDDVRVDGAPLPYFTQIGWRGDSSRSFGVRSVTAARAVGSALEVELNTQGEQAVALLAPLDVPRVLPVLMGRTARPSVVSSEGSELTLATSGSGDAHVRPIGTTESTPYFGPAALLVDYTMYSRTNSITDGDTIVHVLARSDTPPSVLDQLAANGIGSPLTLDQARHTLDQDAFALALNLYLVVTVVVLLLALTGLAVNMAVQLPARRRDAASLRVVGLPRRSLVTAVAAELTTVLGAAAVAGILAGAVSQYVVVRTLTLGYADNVSTPRVLPSLNLTAIAALVMAAVAVLLCLGVVLGGLIVRGARTATLREDAG